MGDIKTLFRFGPGIVVTEAVGRYNSEVVVYLTLWKCGGVVMSTFFFLGRVAPWV